MKRELNLNLYGLTEGIECCDSFFFYVVKLRNQRYYHFLRYHVGILNCSPLQ